MSTETTSPAVEGEPTTALTADVTTQPGTTATETKPAEGATTAEGKSETTEKVVEGAPEKYEDFKLPEGMKPIPAVMEKFQALAKERNLSQTDAQKLADIAVEMQQATVETQTQALKALNTEWIDATKTDKEFGGEKLSENLAVAQKAIKAFASPELVSLLNKTGFGNNPELIRAFYRAGKAMSEDTFVPAGGAAPAGKSTGELLYPTMTH